jgi:dTDP-4-dehydrorhamnose reductase
MQTIRKPRLLVIGSKGFIGQHMIKTARGPWDVVSADSEADLNEPVSFFVDIADAESVCGLFQQTRPDAAVLLAAMSDIDRCEREPDRAWAVNVQGAENVVKSCVETGARLLFVSSAAVFDGTQHGYKEEDHPHPLSTYGRTKHQAEIIILKILPSAIIVRLALVLGFSPSAGTNALLNRLEQALRAGRAVHVPADEYRNPIDVGTLSRVLVGLMQNPAASGIYHLGSIDTLSRYEMTRQLAEEMGFQGSQVIPQTGPQPDRALRGKDHLLLTERIAQICDIPLGTAHDVIRRSLDGFTQSSLRT